jgi:hypothetical protein
MTDIGGTTAPGFERARDAFAANFAKGLEIGAAFRAYHRGEKVVGWADPDAEMAFGYVPNRMDMGLAGDARSFDLVNACLAASR